MSAKMTRADFSLPIDEVLGDIAAALRDAASLVLIAPPGAGKTTRVPLALVDEPWVAGRKIILLEPRRLAARAAANRMAAALGERVGQTVGLRVRMETLVSAQTRIEVVTEGVFTRMLLGNPGLDGIAAVIFDEFHERSLDADLGLALAIDVQTGLREDLRLIVMSATLDGARVGKLLPGARSVVSEGRMFPVETKYVGRDPARRIDEEVVSVIVRALGEESGSILAFLPGQAEIMRAAAALEPRCAGRNIDIAPLYGAMERTAQDLALSPAATGRRKVVLATSIAETSLTIEGVRIVVDSGLARVPKFEPELGLTRLETVRESRSSADQRRGRAGRTEHGVCYRLWEQAATGAMPAFATPEILSADLSGLVLDLADWGVHDVASLSWLDAPPRPAVEEARALLQQLGGIDAQGSITASGRAMRSLPLPPRLARMVIVAAESGEGGIAAEIGVLLGEKGLGGMSIDLAARIENFRRDRSGRAMDARQMASGWARLVQDQVGSGVTPKASQAFDCGRVLALAFPDRIAWRRDRPGYYLLANGRAASLEPHESLASAEWIAVAELTGRAGASRIVSAAAISGDDVLLVAGREIVERQETIFDPGSASLRARSTRTLGAIVLSDQPAPVSPGPDATRRLLDGIAVSGIDNLPWTPALRQMRDRVGFLRKAGPQAWPDLSDSTLRDTIVEWLGPFVDGKTSLAAISADDLEAALRERVGWEALRRLDLDAPTHFTTPAGSRIAVDFEAEGGPAISVRVQELFGLSTHPALADGRVPLTLHLLSPAHRPIQITRDLPGFWRGSWSSVKSEMRGRYPRHVWPDDPVATAPTTRAKPRQS